jgi:hypothetical protein
METLSPLGKDVMFRKILLSLLLLIAGCGFSVAAGNKNSSGAKGINQANAPVPAPLLTGKKVFISFDLGDVLAFPSVYSGGPERAYNEFYSAMKQWGHYDLALDPKDADLIFSIRFVEGHDLAWPQLRVVMTDAKTHVVLWGMVEQIDGALFKKHRDQAFSNSIMRLVDDIQELLAPGSPQPFLFDDSGKTRLADQAQ